MFWNCFGFGIKGLISVDCWPELPPKEPFRILWAVSKMSDTDWGRVHAGRAWISDPEKVEALIRVWRDFPPNP